MSVKMTFGTPPDPGLNQPLKVLLQLQASLLQEQMNQENKLAVFETAKASDKHSLHPVEFFKKYGSKPVMLARIDLCKHVISFIAENVAEEDFPDWVPVKKDHLAKLKAYLEETKEEAQQVIATGAFTDEGDFLIPGGAQEDEGEPNLNGLEMLKAKIVIATKMMEQL